MNDTKDDAEIKLMHKLYKSNANIRLVKAQNDIIQEFGIHLATNNLITNIVSSLAFAVTELNETDGALYLDEMRKRINHLVGSWLDEHINEVKEMVSKEMENK